MTIEEARAYCLEKAYTSEDMPFDETTLVIRVHGKIFALLSLDEDASLNLKCDPEKAIELRERYSAIVPGYHMNKKLWNTIYLKEMSSHIIIKELIDHSFDEVVKKLPLKLKKTLQ